MARDNGAVHQGWRGFFGKIPQAGDFVGTGLPRTFETTLDTWLRAAMRESQATLGRGWLDAFLVTPVWRFALGPGIAGADPVTGVMMPSVDRVGRYFPLALAVARSDLIDNDTLALCQDRPFFDAAEALVLSCLSAPTLPSDLSQGVANLPLGELPKYGAPDPSTPAVAYWWTASDDNRSHITEGLPSPGDFAALFLGNPPDPEGAGREMEQGEALQLVRSQMIAPEDRARTPAVPPPSQIQLLEADHAAACLRGTRSGALTDAVAVNADTQAFSLLSGIGTAPSLPAQIAGLVPLFEGIADPFSMNDLIAAAKGKFGSANTRLFARAGVADESAAVAALVLLVQARRYAVLWVGHCSAFLLRQGTLHLLNRPHVDTRLRGMVSLALGSGPGIAPDSAIGQAEPGDRFLLASPGVTSVLPDEEIAYVLKSAETPRAAVTELTQNALIAGTALDASALCVFLNPKVNAV
ncbi:type VI secretion system-associated protein TagF [Tateyamaria omphalii]|uniref:type VI secretion system-associated protein TagF n=1 Tax=Tateyamaria omphalii TaxID=299262 RepID=UPI001C99471A|nr:type VI secretion system-associated protein TagF [Tateyamaria omphalii]MBY5931954.1 type VI secretion system-associated protein TagF [Tateyamaria omphalii]